MPIWERTFVSSTPPTGPRNGAGFYPCQGLYHAPSGGAHTALIATHYNVDFSEHYLGPFMAERGFGFLGWNTRFRGNEGYFLLEHALIDRPSPIEWTEADDLAAQPGAAGASGGEAPTAH